MSTFFNTSTTPSSSTAEGSIQITPQDDIIVRRFREATSEVVAKLNADLGLAWDATQFSRWQTYFRTVVRRDPSIGELRLLDALEREGRGECDREAIGEFYTNSAALAATWADMMEKHTALHHAPGTRLDADSRPVPPCTFTDALTLIGRYLYRSGQKQAPHKKSQDWQPSRHYTLIATPWQEAEAAAAGYRPVVRVAVGVDEIRTLCVREGVPHKDVPEKAGDSLILLRGVAPDPIYALMREDGQKKHPLIAAIRAIARSSPLATVLELCSAADLYVNRLVSLTTETSPGRLPLETLCARRTPTATAADFLLRVPAKQVHELTENLRQRGYLPGTAVFIIGQVRTDERTVIHMRNMTDTKDIPIVDLPTAALQEAASIHLHRRRPETVDVPSPLFSVQRPPHARLPAVAATQDGLAPNGCETVALTVHPAPLLSLSEEPVCLASATTLVSQSGEGYRAAMETVASAVAPLADAPIDRNTLSLSVSVTAHDLSDDLAPGDRTLEVLCGLYRAAAEAGVPVVDPVMTVARPDATDSTPTIRLTVTAWACRLTIEPGAHPIPSAIHQEQAPLFLPVLRRSYEGSLRAIVALLNRGGRTPAIVQPLVIDQIREPLPTPEGEEEATPPAFQTREVLNRDAVQTFLKRLEERVIPVLALSEQDTRLLLNEPTIRAALEQRIEAGYPLVALHESCRPLAEIGLLPACLEQLTTVPAAGTMITVQYALPQHTQNAETPAQTTTATRLLRRDLLAPTAWPQDEAPSLLTLVTETGDRIPDGFMGREGRVFGLLNGFDRTVATLCRACDFRWTN